MRTRSPGFSGPSTNAKLENKALLSSFEDARSREDFERQTMLQGLQGLAGTNTMDIPIANLMQGIGQTRAQGITGAAQAREMGRQNMVNNLMGLGSMALGAGNVGSFSDIRLKDNIRHAGTRGQWNWYRWSWNDEARELGLSGETEGVLAHEVYESRPDVIGVRDGYIVVDYDRLEIR